MSWSPELPIGELRPWPDTVHVVRGKTGETRRYVPEGGTPTRHEALFGTPERAAETMHGLCEGNLMQCGYVSNSGHETPDECPFSLLCEGRDGRPTADEMAAWLRGGYHDEKVRERALDIGNASVTLQDAVLAYMDGHPEYDSLFCSIGGCGCYRTNLAPCCEPSLRYCYLAHRVPVPAGEDDAGMWFEAGPRE